MHRVERARLPSVLLALQELLNSGAVGEYRCVHANVEAGREDTRRAMRTILGEPASRARFALRDDFVDELRLDILDRFGPDGALKEILSRWAQADPRPLVLLIDEIDTWWAMRYCRCCGSFGRDTPGALPPERHPVRRSRRAGLPHPLGLHEGSHRRRERVQHQGRIVAPWRFFASRSHVRVREMDKMTDASGSFPDLESFPVNSEGLHS